MKVFERVSGCERECRRFRHADSTVTQRAQRQLPVTRQFRRIHDRLVHRFRSARRVEISVLLTWTMTSFARNTKNVISRGDNDWRRPRR